MLVKALPGLGIALVLAVFFNLPVEPERLERPELPKPRPERTVRRRALQPRSVLFPVVTDKRVRAADNVPLPAVASGSTNAAGAAGMAKRNGGSARPVANVIFSGAFLPAKAARPPQPTRTVLANRPFLPPPSSEAPAPALPVAERDGLVRLRGARLAGKNALAVTSHSAFASVDAVSGFPCETAAVEPAVACAEPPPPPFRSRVHYRELPAKGIYAWSRAEKSTVRMDGNRTRRNAFDLDGTTYSVGVKYDWSVDSVIGLSVGRLDMDIDNSFAGDSRKNDIKGTVFAGRYDGYIAGKYPFTLGGFYGGVQSKGGGGLGGGHTVWTEDKHDSDYYGMAASFRLPLIFSNQYKMIAEVGVGYRRLKTDAYSYRLSQSIWPVTVDARSSESLLIPVDFTFKKDFAQTWGILTPSLGLGAAFELKKTATGLRSWHASAAAAARYRTDSWPAGAHNVPEFDDWSGALAKVKLGVEARTVGGWEMRAGYTHIAASGYKENHFNLELGKCF